MLSTTYHQYARKQVHETANRLRDNLRVEQHVIADLANALYHGVFRPCQMATVFVKCYPAVPFVLGVANAVAAEYGAVTGEDMGLTEEHVSGPNALLLHAVQQQEEKEQAQPLPQPQQLIIQPKIEPESLEAARAAVDLIEHAAVHSPPQPAYSPPQQPPASPQQQPSS